MDTRELPDTGVKQALSDAEIRILIVEATRVKNGEVRTVILERHNGSFKVTPLVKAA